MSRRIFKIIIGSIRNAYYICGTLTGGFLTTFLIGNQALSFSLKKSFALGVGVFTTILFSISLYKIIRNNRLYVKIKYSKNFVAYIPFHTSLDDVITPDNQIIPIVDQLKKISLTTDEHGIRFSNDYYLYSYIKKLPAKNDARTFFFWFRLSGDFDFEETSFFFSYGNAKSGKAFGLLYGKPELAITENKDMGVRLFLYVGTKTKKENLKNKNCDSDYFINNSQLKRDKWFYIALSYSPINGNFSTIYFGDEKHLISQPHMIEKTIDTCDTNYLYFGSIISEYTQVSNDKKDNYNFISQKYPSYNNDQIEDFMKRNNDNLQRHILPINRYAYNGYIREFMVFNSSLNKKDIAELASITSTMLS